MGNGAARNSSVLPVGADFQRRGRPSPAGSRTAVASTDGGKRREREWSLTLSRKEGDVLGAALGDTDIGAVIINIQEGGLLGAWNDAKRLPFLYPGLIITAVNGVRGYWGIVEELEGPLELNLRISDQPPKRAGPTWFEDVAALGKSLEKQRGGGGGWSSFMFRLRQEGPDAPGQFSSLPNVVGGDCCVDQCAICLDDVAPDETLVQLKCKHAFHPKCAARWLTQCRGRRQCCPLCCQRVL